MTDQPQTATYVPKKRVVFIWVLLLFLSVACLINNYLLFNALDKERHTQDQALELIQTGYKIKGASDLLTAQARAFAITQNLEHLHAFWHEANITKTRDLAIASLKQLGARDKEALLLIKAKRRSDQLINTEIRSMKLVLSAYNTPKALYPPVFKYHMLKPSDQQLSPSEKISLAQKILFDAQYSKAKASIMQPINQFTQKALARITANNQRAQNEVNTEMMIFSIILILMIMCIISMIWTRIDQLRG